MNARDTREGLELGHLERCDRCGDVWPTEEIREEKRTDQYLCPPCFDEVDEDLAAKGVY